jgi:hypothetical protein
VPLCGRGYENLRYLLLKAQRMAATKTGFVAFQKAAQNGPPVRILRRACKRRRVNATNA